MFKKLKDKIAEEVKQSPLKSVQQLAQAVVSPSSSSVFEPSSSNDKFCIEDGDIEEQEASAPAKSGGFTSVTLTGQTSSPLREPKLSFRSSPGLHTVHEAENFFPVFEPQPTNFHVQSEAESASEVEDRYSHLEHINKESLYEAYRKVYNRYNRMKNKYHELVTHYRQLDREKERAKTVLTETQDKALLRISELREQCVLEQQAKAHLEEALRNELEERDHIISSLKTKVQYLKTTNENGTADIADGKNISISEDDNLIDFTDNSQVTKVPSPSVASSDSDWPEEQIKKFKEFFNERSARVETLKSQLEILKKSDVNWNTVQEGLKTDNDVFWTKVDPTKNSNVLDSMERLLNELTEEVKTVQDITDAYFQQKTPVDPKTVQSFSKELLDSRPDRKASESGDKTNNISELDLEKLVSQYKEENIKHQVALKELEKQNQNLNKQLHEYVSTKELAKQKYEDLKSTCATLKSYLQIINENCSTDTFTTDVIGSISSSKDELSQEILKCVQNLRSAKIEVKSLNSQFERWEKDHKDIIIKLESKLSEKETLSKEVGAENKTLREQLERLKKDNNLHSSQQESLKIEVSDLRKERRDVENQVKSLSDLIKKSEEEIKDNQEALKLANLNFIEEKNTLQSKLAVLQSDLLKENQNCSTLQEENKELNGRLLNLKKEIETLLADKTNLQIEIKGIKTNINQTKQDNSKLLESREKEVDEMSLKQQEWLSKEKEKLSIKINEFEMNLEKSKSDMLIVTQAKEKLSKELEIRKKELEDISAEKVNLQAKVDYLKKELKVSKENNTSSSETMKQITYNLDILSKQHQELTAENNNALKQIKDLNRDLELEKSQSLSYSSINDKLLHNFQALEKSKNESDGIINVKQTKIQKLEEEIENINKLLVTEIQSKKELLSESTLEKNSLLLQIKCLKEELSDHEKKIILASIREDKVNFENSKLIENVNMLNEELQSRKEEFKSTMSEIMKTYEELSSEKIDLEKSIEEIKQKLKSKVEELDILKSINEQSAQDLISLKSIKNQEQMENSEIISKYEKLLAEFEEIKQDHSLMSESKNKVNEELTSLKQEYKNTLSVMDEMKNELQNQQQLCLELNQSLNELSDSFQLKSNEIEVKCQENKQLENNLKSMSEKCNLLQILSTEKGVVLENLTLIFNDIKYLKQIRQNLMEFVSQFKKEIFEELNLIGTTTEKELLCQTKNILEEHEISNQHLIDIEIKTKEEINAFNSKLQNLEAELHKANDSLEENICRQCEMEKNKLKETKIHLYTDKHNVDIFHYQLMCNDLHTNLNQAIKLLRFLKENSVSKQHVQQINGIAHLGLKEEEDLELNESWSSEKMFLEVDVFLKKYEKISLDTNVNSLVSKLEATEYLKDDIPFEQPCDTLVLSRNDVSIKDLRLKVQQLLQELNTKNELIKKLQATVEKYELDKNLTTLQNHQTFSQLSLKSEESREQAKEDESKDEKLVILEQENHALMQKVLELQEIQNITSDYENKLEERTLFDLGREKKHTISELKEQIQNLQQDLDDRGDAYEKLYEDHHQILKQREEEARQLRINYEKEMREQDKKWRSCLDRRVAEEEIRHQAEVNELTSEWTKQRKELETASRLAVSVVESGSSSNEMLRRQVQALTVQLNELEVNRCEMCDTKRAFSRERRKSNGSSHSIQDCTEMEYLRNILYEYMMGKEPLVLAKVLCALVKFDDIQTNDIVVKEQQKITLLGQLGLQ